jgi:hypothetical protein
VKIAKSNPPIDGKAEKSIVELKESVNWLRSNQFN